MHFGLKSTKFYKYVNPKCLHVHLDNVFGVKTVYNVISVNSGLQNIVDRKRKFLTSNLHADAVGFDLQCNQWALLEQK